MIQLNEHVIIKGIDRYRRVLAKNNAMNKADLLIKKSTFFISILNIVDSSKISNSLLIKFDESIELFIPIFHFG